MDRAKVTANEGLWRCLNVYQQGVRVRPRIAARVPMFGLGSGFLLLAVSHPRGGHRPLINKALNLRDSILRFAVFEYKHTVIKINK